MKCPNEKCKGELVLLGRMKNSLIWVVVCHSCQSVWQLSSYKGTDQEHNWRYEDIMRAFKKREIIHLGADSRQYGEIALFPGH